jgi:hypothetical protein
MIFAISLADRREAPSLALGVFDAQQQGCGVEQRRAGCSVLRNAPWMRTKLPRETHFGFTSCFSKT